jgi:hypothetical protein
MRGPRQSAFTLKKSTIVTSQLPVDHWHEVIVDPTIADAVLDRLASIVDTGEASAPLPVTPATSVQKPAATAGAVASESGFVSRVIPAFKDPDS